MTTPLTLTRLNEMDCSSFVAVLGGIYEHGSWVAERAWYARPFADRPALELAMQHVVRQASRAEQLRLLRGHPQLGVSSNLTGYSHAEQTGAGLLEASDGRCGELADLNEAYQRRFGFPFILSVRDLDLDSIIDSCRQRINNDSETEFRESLCQVFKIAGFRLADAITEQS